MQDRFKFRAKLKGMDKWVYGAYLKMLPYQPYPVGRIKPLETEYKHLIITEGSADWGMPREISTYEVIPETVGQCTGSKDDNGKLMYEGDIVKIWKFSKDLYGNDKRVIKWNDARCGFRLYTIEQYKRGIELCPQSMVNVTTIDVIGNIFQNPELLKDGK